MKNLEMRVANFQLQTSDLHNLGPLKIIQLIDAHAPIPQPLEGGDGNGPLFECILRDDKVEALQKFCDENPSVRIYTSIEYYDMNDYYYRPNWHVQWQFGGQTTVTEKQ
jgi:hypothetical protein